MPEPTPNQPIPFPPRPGVRPVEPPPMQPTPPAPMPQSDPGDEDQPKPDLPTAAIADPFGMVRLATLQAEHAELLRVLSLDGAAGTIDAMAGAIAFGPAATFSRSDVVGLLRSAAAKVRLFRDPSALAARNT